MLQGGLIILMSFPIFFINTITTYYLPWAIYAPGPGELGFHYIDLAGIIIWTVGFLFETIGDLQMFFFKRNPENKGKIMNKGLWKYTRHPNYFGETTLWWGIFLMVIPITKFFPYVWFSIISPIVITFLLLRVSGITLLERKWSDNTEYEEYKRKTSAFIPWFPKKDKK